MNKGLNEVVFDGLKNCKIKFKTSFSENIVVIRKLDDRGFLIGVDDDGEGHLIPLDILFTFGFEVLEENVPIPKRKVKKELKGNAPLAALVFFDRQAVLQVVSDEMIPMTDTSFVPVTITYEEEEEVE